MVRDHRLVDNSPGRDVHCRVCICRCRVTTRYTGEKRLSNSIALIDTTTYGACSAGVARVNENHGDPSKFCLIGDILPKLVKRPVCVSCPLLAPSNRYPVTYTAKVLHGDGASGVLRFLHEPFADQVIGVLLVTSLFARNFLEFSLCCLRLFPLKVAATMGIDPAFGLNNVPTVNDSVTVRCDIDNSQVYTQCFGNRFGFWNLHFAGRGKIKAAFMNAQITLAPHSNQQFPLTFPANKWDARPPSNGQIDTSDSSNFQDRIRLS